MRTRLPVLFRAIQGVLGRSTDKAVLIRIHAPESQEHGKEHWFPLSQLASVHRTYNLEKGTFDVLMASEWILGQKGLLSSSLEKRPVHVPENPLTKNLNRRHKDQDQVNKNDEGVVGSIPDYMNESTPTNWAQEWENREDTHGPEEDDIPF